MKNDNSGLKTGIYFFVTIFIIGEIILFSYIAIKLNLFDSGFARDLLFLVKSETITFWLILVIMFAIVVIPVIITARIGLNMIRDIDKADTVEVITRNEEENKNGGDNNL